MGAQVVQHSASIACVRREHVGGCRRAGAFTIVDVLVTMAVIGILIAIMLPSLASVRETAHQVVCRSNVRQLAIGVAMYADANADTIPRTGTITAAVTTTGSNQNLSYDTITVRFGTDGMSNAVLQGVGWDGLGLLYSNEYTSAPKVFYCPSHRGSRPYRNYVEAWANEGTSIDGNFQYRGQGPTGRFYSTGLPVMSTRVDRIAPGSSLVADGLRSKSDFNHQVGANVMRADISVSWFNDSGHEISATLTSDGQAPTESQIQNAWNELDRRSNR